MLPDASVAPLALSPLRLPDVSRQLAFEDRVVAVEGAPVSSAAEVHDVVSRVPEGTPLRYTVRREGAPDRDLTLATTTFTGSDYAELFLPFLLGGLVGLALGLMPVLARPDLTAARLFFLGSLGLAVNFAFLAPDAYIVHHLPRWGFVFLGLAVAAFLHLALVMPVVRA